MGSEMCIRDRMWDIYFKAVGGASSGEPSTSFPIEPGGERVKKQSEVKTHAVSAKGSQKRKNEPEEPEVQACHLCTDGAMLYEESDVHCEASRLHKKGELYSQMSKDFLAGLNHRDYLQIVSEDPASCFKWGHTKLCSSCRKCHCGKAPADFWKAERQKQLLNNNISLDKENGRFIVENIENDTAEDMNPALSLIHI